MPDELLQRLRRFQTEAFPQYEQHFKALVDHGQRPTTLFIGCSDSRLMPHLLTGSRVGELFLVRNVGALVPPYDGYIDGPHGTDGANPPRGLTHLEAARRWVGYHGTAAAIEFAVLQLGVQRIVVCGHSHCGAMKALYGEVSSEAKNLNVWLDLAREAVLPVVPGPEALRRTEQRAVVLQLERLMGYPMVRRRVEARELTLHGWHYVIEDGELHVFDVQRGCFVPASAAEHSGTGPYKDHPSDAELLFNEIGGHWPVG